MNNFFNPFYRPIYPTYNFSYQKTNFDMNDNASEISEEPETLHSSKSSQAFEPSSINVFGLELYSDDILILLLIFFLYNENSNDTLLFIILFALLI